MNLWNSLSKKNTQVIICMKKITYILKIVYYTLAQKQQHTFVGDINMLNQMCTTLVFEQKYNFFNTLTTDHRTTFLLQDCSLSSCVSFTITRLKRQMLFNLVIYFPLKIIFCFIYFFQNLLHFMFYTCLFYSQPLL